jgi:pyroglutamyl-peptidase
MRAVGDRCLPRVLVTGFEAFPGAPVNPTEALVKRLRKIRPRIAGMGAFAAEVLPVDYNAIGTRLAEIGRVFQPDIAVHFGLSQRCRGFRLERYARNSFVGGLPDNRGFSPPDGPICDAAERLPSTLPLQAIHGALADAGLPVEWSDDAGGYLCNVTFALSVAAACDGFSPAITGFIHLPLLGRGMALSAARVDRGVRIILTAAIATWRVKS